MSDDLMLKATQAAESARALLTRSDADGACNRAYYAMFDAASGEGDARPAAPSSRVLMNNLG